MGYYKKADNRISANKIKEMVHYVNINLGDIYEKLKKIDSAQYYYNLTYQNAIQTQNIHNEALAYIGLGNVYSKIGQEYLAIQNYNKAIPILNQEKNFELLSETYLGLAKF